MDFLLSAEQQRPDWLLPSEAKQTNFSLERKHIWCGFVSYKGTHSLQLNCFGDSIILNSPPIQYLCLACRSRRGANEMPQFFKQLLSREWLQQTGRLPQWLVIVCHFKKKAITSSPVGRGESRGWGVMWLSGLSADGFLFVSCSLSAENCTQFTLSQVELSIYLKDRCQRCDGWEKDLIFPLADAQPPHRLTVQSTSSMFLLCCEFLSAFSSILIAEPMKASYLEKKQTIYINNQP